jgi:hypothetical protein
MSRYPRTQRRQVLNEQDYQNGLTAIIQRDYFPCLPALECDIALQDRREARDLPGAVAVRRAARALRTEHLMLEQEEQEQQLSSDGLLQIARPLSQESLTGYHLRVISDSSAEFEHVQNREILQQRQAFLSLSKDPYKDPSLMALSIALNGTRHPLVPSPLGPASDHFDPPFLGKPFPTSTEPYNSLFFVPEAHQKQGDSSPLWLTKTPEEMPPPERRNFVAFLPKNRVDKMIEPAATRFQTMELVVRRRKIQDWDVSSCNTEMSGAENSTDDASTDLDAPAEPLHIEQRRGRKRKKRELESLLHMTPRIVPGQGRVAENASPIITRGVVGATPIILGQETGSVGFKHESTFRMPEETERDIAAVKAQAKLAYHARRRPREAGSTFRLFARDALLSPAAKVLLTKTFHPPSARSASSFGTALRSSYTPITTSSCRSQIRSTVRHPRDDTVHNATPRIIGKDL